MNLTTGNCRKTLIAKLCNIPCEWQASIANAICDMLGAVEVDCDEIRECETLTTLSEFTVDGNTVCVTYRDELGEDNVRCFDFTDTEVVITADNGLLKDSPTNIQLGGVLIHDTTILSGGFNLAVSGLTLYDGGEAQLTSYGQGNFLDTPLYGVGVTADGGLIEYEIETGSAIDVTADNGLFVNTPGNIQLGSPTLTDAPLLHDSYISGAFNLSLNDGTFTVGVTAPIIAKATIVTTSDYFSILGRKQVNTTGNVGEGIAIDGQFLITGGTTYTADGPFGGLYGELGFLGSGSWNYTGTNKEMQLGGLNGVTTIYTQDASSYNSGLSIFSGGQYFLNAAGSGNIDKFAAIRALYPLRTPGLSFTGTITNHYGVLIEDIALSPILSTVTNRWGVYQQGLLETNVFNGKIVTPNYVNAVDDTAAAIGGVGIGQHYRNGSQVMVRVT